MPKDTSPHLTSHNIHPSYPSSYALSMFDFAKFSPCICQNILLQLAIRSIRNCHFYIFVQNRVYILLLHFITVALSPDAQQSLTKNEPPGRNLLRFQVHDNPTPCQLLAVQIEFVNFFRSLFRSLFRSSLLILHRVYHRHKLTHRRLKHRVSSLSLSA